jgi:5'-nucleotidase
VHILLSNDDGYLAPGLRTLYQSLKAHPDVAKVTVVAPERNRSAASNSLTLQNPLRVHKDQVEDDIFFVTGTPADCVHLALTGFVETPIDLVISGINEGANMGDDVIYSGTVAAAMEGRFMGYPAISVSLNGDTHYDTAAQVVLELLVRFNKSPLAHDTLLNVNVPDVPYAQLKGREVTRLGTRHKAEPMIKTKDPRGKTIYWVGPAGAGADAGDGTDFYAVSQCKVAMTPISVDLTHYTRQVEIRDWLTVTQ